MIKLSPVMRVTAAGLLLGSQHLAIAQENPPRPPDYVVPAARPKAPTPISLTAKLPAGYIAPLGRQLGLNPCDYPISRFAGLPVNAVSLVEASGNGCIVWDSQSAPDIKSFLGSIDVDHARIPVVGYARMQPTAHDLPVIVLDLVGGPAGDISPGLNDSLQLALVKRGAVVVKPAYAGTRHRSHYPNPDLDMAVHEVTGIITALHHASPKSRIILMGESLGGYIAAKTITTHRNLPLSGLMLVVPLIYSQERAIENFRRMAQKSRGAFTQLWIRVAPSKLPVKLPAIASVASPDGYQAISSMDLFEAYFPIGSRTSGLLDHLNKRNSFPTLIAYGETDERVGVEELVAATSLPDNVHLLKLERNGHVIDDAAAERVAKTMWSSFSHSTR